MYAAERDTCWRMSTLMSLPRAVRPDLNVSTMYESVGYVRSFIYTVVLDFYKRSFKHPLTFEVTDANTVIVQKAEPGRFPRVDSFFIYIIDCLYIIITLCSCALKCVCVIV